MRETDDNNWGKLISRIFGMNGNLTQTLVLLLSAGGMLAYVTFFIVSRQDEMQVEIAKLETQQATDTATIQRQNTLLEEENKATIDLRVALSEMKAVLESKK